MIKQIIKIVLLSLTTILCWSCAQTESIPTNNLSLISFQRWMQLNAPQAKVLPGNKNGDIYIEYINKAPKMNDSLKVKDGMWLYYKYTGYTMKNISIATRDSVISRISGTWLNTTHWVDDFVQYKNTNGSVVLCSGITEILPLLNTGDHVRVYLAASQAFNSNGMTINDGYLGESTEYSNVPCYFDIKMGRTLSNPLYDEMKRLKEYAKTQWGLEAKDSVIKNIYMHKLVSKPNGDIIGGDSTLHVFYTQTFTDGFLIKTNSDSIAKKYNRYSSSNTYGYTMFKPTSEVDNLPSIFYKLVMKMRRGEVASFIVPSYDTKEGISGNFSSAPQIPSYNTSIYTLQILTLAEAKYQDKKK